MMKKIFFYVFILSYVTAFSETHGNVERNIDTRIGKCENVHKLYCDSIYLLLINDSVLNNVIKSKTSYMENDFKEEYKYMIMDFQTNKNIDYIRITANVPLNWISKKNLYGVVLFNGFQLYVYNNTKKSIDKFFDKIGEKYFQQINYDEDNVFLINTPTWFYVLDRGFLKEVKR